MRTGKIGLKAVKQSQSDKFINTARELETDESEEAFDAALKRIAKAKTPPHGKQRSKSQE